MESTSQHGAERSQLPVLNRIPARFLMDVLNSVGNIQALLNAGLALAADAFSADRGIAFDHSGTIVSFGYSEEKALDYRDGRLMPNGQPLVYFRAAQFTDAAKKPSAAVGIAVTTRTQRGRLTLALERTQGKFEPEEAEDLSAVAMLLRNPAERTFEITTLKRQAGRVSLKRIEDLPQLRQLEKMLIREALKRSKSQRQAAKIVGVTREGLRKKMIRLHLIQQSSD